MQDRPRSDPQDSHLISAANVLTKAITQPLEAKRKEWNLTIFVFDIISQRFREGGYYLSHEDIALLRCISPNENVLTFMELPSNTRMRLIFQRQLILKQLLELTENSSALSTHLLNYLAQMPLIGSESRSTWYLIRIQHLLPGPMFAYSRG